MQDIPTQGTDTQAMTHDIAMSTFEMKNSQSCKKNLEMRKFIILYRVTV